MTAVGGGILMTMHRMSQGGADRVAVLLANGFHAAGIPVDFLLLRSGGEAERTLTALLNPGVRLHVAGSPMGTRHLELARGVSAIRSLTDLVRPSLILASSSNMGLVTGVAARPFRRLGIGVAMKLTNPVIRPRDRLSLQRAYRTGLYGFIFGRYDRVLTLTHDENRYLQGKYPSLSERFEAVPNAYIPDGLFAVRPRPSRGHSSERHLLALARMMPQKRLDILLEAFARIARQDTRLTILGDGPLRPKLEARARALGIAERVSMPGFVADTQEILGTADLLVLSSDYEGLPAAVIEALALNVRVVTTDSFFGARDLLEASPSCAVTPVGDAAALARAIGDALASPQPRDLRDLVAAYGIQASVDAHIAALRPLIKI